MENKIFPLAELILLIGLAFNIVGTFLMAFSITFGYKIRTYYLDDGKDDKKYAEADLVKFNKHLFRCGIYTLGMGFIFQLTSIFFRINS